MEDDDMYWNYQNALFLMTSLFSVSTIYENYGDGLGSYIVNKILLPVIHGLKHSNYSNSIHRFITRILCEATPKEGMKLMFEKFSNRVGKPGCNINRDRRMEYRIGELKKLLGNIGGSNFTPESVQQVNSTVDIKEELYLHMRKLHGVDIRSGKHNARSNSKDYSFTIISQRQRLIE